MLAERQQRPGLLLAGLGALAFLAVGCGGDKEPTVADVSAEDSPTAAPTLGVATAAPTATSEATYTVQAGDTLYDLALEWDTTVEAIVALNGLADANVLAVGQVLKIPPRSEQ